MSNNQLKSIKIYTNNGIPTSIGFLPVEGKEEQRPFKEEYIKVIQNAYPSIVLEYVEIEKSLVSTSNDLQLVPSSENRRNKKYIITAAAIITAGALVVNGVLVSKKAEKTYKTNETMVTTEQTEIINNSEKTMVSEPFKTLNPNNNAEVEEVARKIIREAEQEPGVHISFEKMVKFIKVMNGVEVENADFMELDNLMYTLMSIDVLDATKLLTGNQIQGKRTPFSTLDMISSEEEKQYMAEFLTRREKLLDSYYYNGDIKGSQKEFMNYITNALLNQGSSADINPILKYFSYHVALTAMPLLDENLEVSYGQGQTEKAKEVLIKINEKSIEIATQAIEVLQEKSKTR